MADTANTWVLEHFGWTYSLTSFLCLAAVAIAYFSPLGNVILEEKDAKPILSKKNWATITLCTAMAAGALFWGISEPIYHMSRPRQEWSLTHGNRLNLLWRLWFFIGPYTLTPSTRFLLSRLPLPFSICKKVLFLLHLN